VAFVLDKQLSTVEWLYRWWKCCSLSSLRERMCLWVSWTSREGVNI